MSTNSTAIRNEHFQRIIAKIEALEQETMRSGFPIAARAMNNAKNTLGWEVSGALEMAGLAAKGERKGERK